MNDCVTSACQNRAVPRKAAPDTHLCATHISDAYDYLRKIPELWANLAGSQALLAQPTGYTDAKIHAGKPGSKPPANLAIISMRDIRTDWQKPGDLLNPQVTLQDIATWVEQTPPPAVNSNFYSILTSCFIITRRIPWAITQPQAGTFYDTLHLIYTQLNQHQPDHQPQHRIRCPHCDKPIRTGSADARCGCTTYTYQQLIEKILE